MEQKPVMHADSVDLRKLNDCSDEIVTGLKALGEEAASRDPWIIYSLLRKVDADSPIT